MSVDALPLPQQSDANFVELRSYANGWNDALAAFAARAQDASAEPVAKYRQLAASTAELEQENAQSKRMANLAFIPRWCWNQAEREIWASAYENEGDHERAVEQRALHLANSGG